MYRERMPQLTGWRRIANAMWGAPNDPQIYGWMDVEATNLLAYLTKARAAGHHLTPTHLAGRAVAHCIGAVPDLNVRLLGDRAIPRDSIDVFFITAVSGGHDLSGVKVERTDQKSAVAVAAELDRRAKELKAGRDPEFTRTKRTMELLPKPALHLALEATVFLTEKLNLDMPMLALHRNPFGSAMITSVGMFGLPQGFAPLAWLYDIPLLVLVGEVTEKPLAIDGQVVVRPVLPITATLDHRYVDGWHVSQAMHAFREYLADPEKFEPELR